MCSAYFMHSMVGPENDQRVWLEDLLGRLGVTATELARKAGLNPSTLTRFLNETDDRGHSLTFRTVRKIEQAVVGLENRPARGGSATGLSDVEASPYDPEIFKDGLARAVEALTGGRNACDGWKVRTGELGDLGIRRGDVMIVDLNETPKPGDIVCAQVYDLPIGGARTVFRLFEPPFLLSGSLDPAKRRPIMVDDNQVMIRGVVIATISPRSHRDETRPAAA